MLRKYWYFNGIVLLFCMTPLPVINYKYISGVIIEIIYKGTFRQLHQLKMLLYYWIQVEA